MRTYINVLIVFLISGFWHGANWTFVVWGLLHGAASVLNRIFKKQWDRLHAVFRWVCTFVFLNLTWLVFRADTLLQAKEIIKRLLAMEIGSLSQELAAKFSMLEIEAINVSFAQNYLIYIFLLLGMFIVLKLRPYCTKQFKPCIWNYFGVMILLIWSVLSLAGESDFIYFGF